MLPTRAIAPFCRFHSLSGMLGTRRKTALVAIGPALPRFAGMRLEALCMTTLRFALTTIMTRLAAFRFKTGNH